MKTPKNTKQPAPASLAVATGSASPITDETWDKYNRRACGLHYVEHKMRGMETALRMAADALESDRDEDRRRAWNTIRDLLEPNTKICRGSAANTHHHE